MNISEEPGSGRDRLIIRGLELWCVIGLHDWERLMPQKVILDIELRGDFSVAADTDAILDAPNYQTLCEAIAEAAASTSYRLLEAFADHIAETALRSHPSAHLVAVAAHKPAALAGFGNATATVEVTRSKFN